MTAREELPGDPPPAPRKPAPRKPSGNWSASERDSFLKALNDKKISPALLARWSKENGRPMPGDWTAEERGEFLDDMAAGKMDHLTKGSAG